MADRLVGDMIEGAWDKETLSVDHPVHEIPLP